MSAFPSLPGVILSRRRSLFLTGILYFCTYLVLAGLAVYFSRQQGSVASLWYANAVIVAACIRRSRTDKLCLLLAGAVANLIVNRYFDASWSLSAIFLGVNVLEMLLSVTLISRYCKLEQSISSPAELLKTLFVGAFCPTLVCAIIAAFSLSYFVPSEMTGKFVDYFFPWFEGSLIGAVSILPAGLYLVARGSREFFHKIAQPQVLSALLLVLAISPVAAAMLTFPYIYMVSFLILLTFKGAFPGASLGILVCSFEVGLLISTGIFPAPPRIYFYYEMLFYMPLLLTMVSPLLVATNLEKEYEEAKNLITERERFRQLYEDTPAMMASVDRCGKIIHVSKLLLDNLYYSKDEIIGRNAIDFFTMESQQRGNEKILPDFMRQGSAHDVNVQMLRRTGEVIDVALSVVWEAGAEMTPTTALCVMRDVTEERRLTARMTYLAQHDALTGLPNRVLFEDRVVQFCHISQRESSGFALMFIDLDHFKDINDTLGHSVGDALLQLISRRLSGVVRDADTICRIGGDEFVILVSGVSSASDAQEVAAKIFREVAVPCTLDGHALQVSLSLGIALFPQDGEDHDTLLRNADTAMYHAKRSGRNRYCFFHDIEAYVQ